MTDVICFQHKSKTCDCLAAAEYSPDDVQLLSRSQALEIFYSCRAFKENIAYSPEAMGRLSSLYLALGDALVTLASGQGSSRETLLLKRLKEAGFGV